MPVRAVERRQSPPDPAPGQAPEDVGVRVDLLSVVEVERFKSAGTGVEDRDEEHQSDRDRPARHTPSGAPPAPVILSGAKDLLRGVGIEILRCYAPQDDKEGSGAQDDKGWCSGQ